MQDIYVVTHTQSQHHVDGRVGGWYDSRLTELGKKQAAATASCLQALVSDSDTRLFSSDLKRAAETASIIGTAIGVPVSLDKGFRENSYGVADGKKQSWLDQRIIVAPDHNRLDHTVIAGAESKRSFISRIYASMSRLPTTSNIVVVTHGYALTFVIAYWIGMSIEDAGYVNFTSTPGGITHLKKDHFFRNNAVKFLNDVSHLPS